MKNGSAHKISYSPPRAYGALGRVPSRDSEDRRAALTGLRRSLRLDRPKLRHLLSPAGRVRSHELDPIAFARGACSSFQPSVGQKKSLATISATAMSEMAIGTHVCQRLDVSLRTHSFVAKCCALASSAAILGSKFVCAPGRSVGWTIFMPRFGGVSTRNKGGLLVPSGEPPILSDYLAFLPRVPPPAPRDRRELPAPRALMQLWVAFWAERSTKWCGPRDRRRDARA